MTAELTTPAVAAQNGDVSVPDFIQPVSINIPAARVTSGTFRISAAIWCMLVAITSDMIGAYWDVAWYQPIGRDTFWPPAHLAIQLCGVDSSPLRANAPMSFRFRIEDRNGRAAQDLEPYTGMAGHGAFVRSDCSVFAHVHPAGSVSMAALQMAQSSRTGSLCRSSALVVFRQEFSMRMSSNRP